MDRWFPRGFSYCHRLDELHYTVQYCHFPKAEQKADILKNTVVQKRANIIKRGYLWHRETFGGTAGITLEQLKYPKTQTYPKIVRPEMNFFDNFRQGKKQFHFTDSTTNQPQPRALMYTTASRSGRQRRKNDGKEGATFFSCLILCSIAVSKNRSETNQQSATETGRPTECLLFVGRVPAARRRL